MRKVNSFQIIKKKIALSKIQLLFVLSGIFQLTFTIHRTQKKQAYSTPLYNFHPLFPFDSNTEKLNEKLL